MEEKASALAGQTDYRGAHATLSTSFNFWYSEEELAKMGQQDVAVCGLTLNIGTRYRASGM